ncbi:serine/threonine-protein kinase [Actinomadura luteofluorescens]|uniref:serine/threonine-protein kinase n=1 Tax=Actinomadura luteofluorescens TaxID=46163 RepID=UPI0030D022C8
MNEWRVDGFDEIRELGSGAQGRVVLAEPRGGNGALVAIKYLAPAPQADEASPAVFRREAETLARVANPHVARLYRYVEGPGGAAIVMEAVTGTSLRAVLDRHGDGGFAPEAALTVLKGSLLGLAAAHAVGVVHRDYKPANVVVQPEGASKLIDFGIAVLTGPELPRGHARYMAPEQWQGEPASPATDIYAASCVFFECLTGARPYRGGSTAQLMAQHLNTPVPLESVPEPVRPMLARGLAKNPGQRLWNAGEFVGGLVLRDHKAGGTTHTGASPRAGGATPAPAPTTVGGKATGQLKLGIRNGRPYGTSQGPSFAYDFSVTPARATPWDAGLPRGDGQVAQPSRRAFRPVRRHPGGRAALVQSRGGGRRGDAAHRSRAAVGPRPVDPGPEAGRGGARRLAGRRVHHHLHRHHALERQAAAGALPGGPVLATGDHQPGGQGPAVLPAGPGRLRAGHLPMINVLPATAPSPAGTGPATARPGGGGRTCKTYEKDGKVVKRVCR